MYQTFRWLSIAFIFCALLVAPGHARAQAGAAHAQAAATGSISGNVTDNRGSPLGGAKVTLVSEDTQASTGASTDGTGQYRFEDLKPGTYNVTFDAQGLVPKTQRVKVRPGHKTTANQRLKPPPEPDTPSK
jgi:protocatechuate 3,4-dioxygenase beta subunit